jgi:hypothetical protein
MPIRLSFIHATWHCRLMWSLSISSVKLFGIPIGLATSRHAPETETLRTMQLIVPWSNAITPAFRVRRRMFFRFSDTAKDFDARAIKKDPSTQQGLTVSGVFLTTAQPREHSAKSLLKSDHDRFCLTSASCPVRAQSVPGDVRMSAFFHRTRHPRSNPGCLRPVQQPRIFCGSDGEVP